MRPLTYLLLAILLSLIYPIVAEAVTIKGNTLEFSDEDIAECMAAGGCRIVTQHVLDDAAGKIELLERQLRAEKSKKCV